MTREQVNPRHRYCLVINMRHAMVPRETSDALSNDIEGFGKCMPVQGKPSESKVIAVAEHRYRQFAAVESREEVIIAQVYGSYRDRHTSF
jgi:hypothetical protein